MNKRRKRRDPSAGLKSAELRGFGRKGRIETFPTKRCQHVEGGKLIYVWRERTKRPFGKYQVPVIVDGIRCTNPAVTVRPGIGKAVCSDHWR